MSYWTYISGNIVVSPMGRTQAEKRYIIEDVLVGVDGYEKSAIIRNPRLKGKQSWETVYGQMNEKPTWCYNDGEIHEPNWCEYLMWDRAKDSMFPMMLGYKYFNDEENDKEVERRIIYMKGN